MLLGGMLYWFEGQSLNASGWSETFVSLMVLIRSCQWIRANCSKTGGMKTALTMVKSID